MRTPGRRRPHRRHQAEVGERDLEALSARVRYEGSVEHKTTPSPAGPPKLRSDASPCPTDLHDFDDLSTWLRAAVRAGHVGAPWNGDFPRYAWVDNEHGCFEARLINREQGTYKGYPLHPEERPRWL
jgi:hypothetical protein